MPISITLEYDADDLKRIEPFYLPVSPEELRLRLDRMGFTPQVMDKISIRAILRDKALGDGIAEIEGMESIVQMDELNYLAAKYDSMDADTKEKFVMVLQYIMHGYSEYPHEAGNIGDTIDIILNLDKFVYYPDVNTLEQLAHRVLENNNPKETIIMELEYYASRRDSITEEEKRLFGKNVSYYDNGCFTSRGYVSGGGRGFEPVFLRDGVPEEYRVWEKAFAELPPFENPIRIDHENLSEGHANEWHFSAAHEVFEYLVAVKHPNFSDGDHKHRAAAIIELAEMIRTQDDALYDMLMDSIFNGGMYGDEAADLVERIANPEYGLDVQLHLERSYGIDNDFAENYRDELMKLPSDLRYDENIRVMMENRVRHQQTFSELSALNLPLKSMPPEQLARFHMLPADKQAKIQMEQDLYILYNRVKWENAKIMINLYSGKIMEYQENHMKTGPYDPEKIAQAPEIKKNIMSMIEKEYDCDPNRQPVVNIDSYGCELFPVGKQFPLPVFNEIFTQAVEYYGLLHDAGVPLSQNLVYLNMDFVMEGRSEQIKFHTDKEVLLFVDQGKSFIEQIAAASSLEPGFREKLTAYLAMHLGVEEQYQFELKALPDAIKKLYPNGLPEEIFELSPAGNSFIRHAPPDYKQQFYDFATAMCEKINQRTDYAAMTFSEPLPVGDIPAIAKRFEALIETIDPSGHEQFGFFQADNVADALVNGDKAKINDCLGVLGNVSGVYRDVAKELAAAIEHLPVRDLQKGQAKHADQNAKPSVAERLAQAKRAAQEQPPKPKPPKKSSPEL